jgi:hypothetical protein
MCGGKAAACLHEHVEDLARRARLAQPLAHRHAVDVLHRDEYLAIGLADVVHRDHVRMCEFRDRARLVAQLFAGARAPQHLQRDAAIELGIVSCVHDAHAAGAESGVKHVAAERARVGRSRCGVIARRLQLRE